MSLRKSPVRTPALLAANRANALKSTGPRTLAGKRASAWNAFQHGYRSRAPWAGEPREGSDRESFDAFVEAFRVAMITLRNEAGERLLKERALSIWKSKRILDHWLQRHAWPPSEEESVLPSRLTSLIHRPGKASSTDWWIRVSVTVRAGRSPGRVLIRRGRPSIRLGQAAWGRFRRRAHTVVSITCTGHPWTRAHRQRIPTNPECHRNGQVWKNVIDDFAAAGPGVGPREYGIIPAVPYGAEQSRPGPARANGWRAAIAAVRDRLRALVPRYRAHAPRVRIPHTGESANEAGMLQTGQDLQKCDAPSKPPNPAPQGLGMHL